VIRKVRAASSADIDEELFPVKPKRRIGEWVKPWQSCTIRNHFTGNRPTY
jgi:hypothetical protein